MQNYITYNKIIRDYNVSNEINQVCIQIVGYLIINYYIID